MPFRLPWYARKHKFMTWVLLVLLAVSSLSFAMYFLVKDTNKNPASMLTGNTHAAPLRHVKAASDGQSLTHYAVPNGAAPKTQAGRQNAPALTLIPQDWVNPPAMSAFGPSGDPAAIPYSARQTLTADVGRFLQAWEDFKVSSDWNAGNADYSHYVNTLSNWVMPSDLDAVAARNDSQQDPGICPQASCTVGSKIIWLDPWNYSSVRFYNGTQAYVNVLAAVEYTAEDPGNPLNGTEYQRAYGLLLQYNSGRWLVTRAAASTQYSLNTDQSVS